MTRKEMIRQTEILFRQIRHAFYETEHFEDEYKVYYPVVVDAKKLSALIMTGNAIIRKPNEARKKHWLKLVNILVQQCKKGSEI